MNDATTHLNILPKTLIDKGFPGLFSFIIWMMEQFDTYIVLF
jgi:hypothetical protein